MHAVSSFRHRVHTVTLAANTPFWPWKALYRYFSSREMMTRSDERTPTTLPFPSLDADKMWTPCAMFSILCVLRKPPFCQRKEGNRTELLLIWTYQLYCIRVQNLHTWNQLAIFVRHVTVHSHENCHYCHLNKPKPRKSKADDLFLYKRQGLPW